MTAIAPSITVMPPGNAFDSTFGKNLPVTLSAFGSRASTTDGIPIVTAPIIVRFCGVKGRGHTVAMTGDGVNDVLALKEADCSVAMASGSDAAKNVSSLVLLDSNFSSMPRAWQFRVVKLVF